MSLDSIILPYLGRTPSNSLNESECTVINHGRVRWILLQQDKGPPYLGWEWGGRTGLQRRRVSDVGLRLVGETHPSILNIWTLHVPEYGY